MIPAPFQYLRPTSLDQALDFLIQQGDDGKILAGGHSLIPAMKLRLAQPRTLIDIGRIADLKYIRESADGIVIGAMTTHTGIERSPLLGKECPLMSEVAGMIGDVQVRNRGTLGGSLVHADPAADWPAAILALEAEMELARPFGRRVVPATEFFLDIMQTAVQPDEILVEVRVPKTSTSVAYVKTAQKASGFAIAGVAVVTDRGARSVKVGVTGVAARAYRANAVEEALTGEERIEGLMESASRHAVDGIEPLGDIHASTDYRAHLAKVNTKRAIELAIGR